MPVLQGNSSKFCQLKYLQLSFFVPTEDINNLMHLVSFLRAAPFVETLEINVSFLLNPCNLLYSTFHSSSLHL